MAHLRLDVHQDFFTSCEGKPGHAVSFCETASFQ
jgi:hypothetical protein